ncbi:MAG: hypothetical protein WCA78_15760 [Rhizomicrobium sp.]
MSPAELREEARRLEFQAVQLRSLAQQRESRTAERQERDRRARIIKQAAQRAARGVDDAEIVRALALQLPCQRGDAQLILAEERSRSRTAQKALRDRLILQQAWKGKTNAEIASRFHLSEKHVSRIVARRLRLVHWPLANELAG